MDKTKERRVVNIDKDSYNIIKEYCNNNALDMPKWLEKIALEQINSDSEPTLNKSKLLLEIVNKNKKKLL